MKTFLGWLTEAKKKKQKSEPQAPTTVSSPIRGANQDQSGFGTKSSVADYTISDETRLIPSTSKTYK